MEAPEDFPTRCRLKQSLVKKDASDYCIWYLDWELSMGITLLEQEKRLKVKFNG